MSKRENPIVIKKGLRIGDLEAETDKDLLSACFVDTGDIDLLLDVDKPESIVVGRTGSGKSALLLQLQKRADKSRILDPNDISIRFLEHSDIIQFFESIGVKLDLFYRFLWRHILTVELLKLRYELKSEQDGRGVLAKLAELVERDPIKKEALSYFREWGTKFWMDTDEQLREVTEKLGSELKAGFGTELEGVEISLGGAKKLSTEKRTEIVHKANKVVNSIQIKKLTDILSLLEDSVFIDRQKTYFLLIDKLDEEWADTETRYRFIRALIEEIKTFRKIRSVKIVVALRRDLLDIVFDRTRDAGFQQEKYESYFLPLAWSKDSLKKMVEERINEVFKRQYTKDGIGFNNVFPSPRKGGGQLAIDHIIERTLLRPRDVMQFINECFTSALNSPRVSWRAITGAEGTYSDKRLKSLYEEWSQVYPCLEGTIEILRGIPIIFKRSELNERLNSLVDKLMDDERDPCSKAVIEYCNSSGKTGESEVVAEILNCLYRVGAVGVKISATEPYMWSDFDNAMLSRSEIKRVNRIKIHKMLIRSLGIIVPENSTHNLSLLK